VGYLIAATLAPALGPVLYRLLHDHPKAVRIVDGSVYLAVPVLVALQVLPHAWEERSLQMIVALGAGFVLPAIVEQASHALAEQTDNLAMVVGLSGLAVHALLEGAALIPGAESVHAPFALAVILHRIPVGLVIWWLIRPRFGRPMAAVGVGSVVLATLAGYGLGTELLGDGAGAGLELYQAFVSGSLVHVVFHQGRHDHDHDHDQSDTGFELEHRHAPHTSAHDPHDRGHGPGSTRES
jgi:zinc transporter ZupT